MKNRAMKTIIALACVALLADCAGSTKNSPALFDPRAIGTLDNRGPGWQTWNTAAFVKTAAVECCEGCLFSVVLVSEGDASISFASHEGSAEEKAVSLREAS
jgi:hypothetical protein